MPLSADLVRISAVKEATYGTTPSPSTAWRILRLNSESLAFQPQTSRSDELSSTRGVVDSVLTGGTVEGGFESDLVFNTLHQDFLASLLGDDNGWTADVLIPGKTRESWAFDKTLYDAAGAAIAWHRCNGVTIDALTISLSPGAIPRCSWRTKAGTFWVALTGGAGTPTWSDPSPALDLAPAMLPHNATITWGGGLSTIGGYTTSIELTIESNNRGVPAISNLGDVDAVLGRLAVTGSAVIYWTDDDAMNAFLDQTDGTLQIAVADTTATPNNHTLTIDMARVRITGNQVLAGGTGQDVVNQITFEALVPGSGQQIQVTRATA